MKPRPGLSESAIKDLSEGEIREVLAGNYICSLSYIAHSAPYVLPVTYFFDDKTRTVLTYSTEGHKVEALRENPEAALCVYEMDSPVRWRSVMVHGRFEEARQIDAKASLHRFAEGVKSVLQSKGIKNADFIEDFSSKASPGGIPVVLQLRIDSWSGKFREG